MGMNEYDSHYGRCLDIEYLVSVAKEKGENLTRNDLEHINKILLTVYWLNTSQKR
jgi:hypothetical protein